MFNNEPPQRSLLPSGNFDVVPYFIVECAPRRSCIDSLLIKDFAEADCVAALVERYQKLINEGK